MTGRLLLAESGIAYLRADTAAWIVPARSIAWVPPGVHLTTVWNGSQGRELAPPAGLTGMPSELRISQTSRLLEASLQRLTLILPDGERSEGLRRLLWDIVALEVVATPAQPLVPMPTAAHIVKAAESVLSRPTAAADLDSVAARAGMSRRSFARHFRKETGLAYSQWKRAVVAQHALHLVTGGRKVSSVAFDVGYESVSAFIAMFRRQFGSSPHRLSIGRQGSRAT